MIESRSKKSIRNVCVVFGSKILQMLFTFLVRTVLIQKLGAEILGLDGLFTSVLSVLSIADLGIGSAVVYALYTPIVENDKKTISAYISFFNKIYCLIGLVILGLGFLTLPFLKYIVNLEQPVDHLEIIYILTILGSSATYFLSSRRIIFEADQKSYKNVSVDLVFNITLQLAQIFLIVVFQDYIIVLIARVLFALMNNIVIFVKGNKEYAYLKKFNGEKLTRTRKLDLWKNTGMILCHKIGGVLVSGTDNTIISAFVGTLYAGFYSNYLIVINSVTNFIKLGINAIIPSVGNLKATMDDIEHHYSVFKELLLINYILSAFAGVMLWEELNKFIIIWIGNEYLLDNKIVLLLCINFYISTMQCACGAFITAAGYFKQTVIKPIAEGIINLIISIILVKQIGMIGVFIGTTVSLLLGSVWVDPFVLYRKWFKKNVLRYALCYCIMATCTIAIGTLVTWIGNLYTPQNFITLILHALILGIVCIFMVLVTTLFLPGRDELLSRVGRFVKKKKITM